jgi:hypothetical protein
VTAATDSRPRRARAMPREMRAARPGCAADAHTPPARWRLATARLVRELEPVPVPGPDRALTPGLGRFLVTPRVAGGRMPATAGVAPAPEHAAAPSASAVVISRAGPGHRCHIVITLLTKR